MKKAVIHSGNTVGSRGIRHWNSKETRELRKSLILSDLQTHVLVGKILGDGSIISTLTQKSYRLQVEQKFEHKEYVQWTSNVFGDWVLSPPSYVSQHNSWRFRTISHPQMTYFRNLFYRDGKKIVPETIQKLLSHPIGLAVWYMDDGGLSSSKRAVTISTHSFSREENEMLVRCLWENFGLQANINWDGKGFRLYIPVKEAKRFNGVIDPYILSVLRYKIPLTP